MRQFLSFPISRGSSNTGADDNLSLSRQGNHKGQNSLQPGQGPLVLARMIPPKATFAPPQLC